MKPLAQQKLWSFFCVQKYFFQIVCFFLSYITILNEPLHAVSKGKVIVFVFLAKIEYFSMNTFGRILFEWQAFPLGAISALANGFFSPYEIRDEFQRDQTNHTYASISRHSA